MLKGKVRVRILHADTSKEEFICKLDKKLESPLDYFILRPLSTVIESISGKEEGAKKVFLSEDAAISVYKLPQNKGYVIQILNTETL